MTDTRALRRDPPGAPSEPRHDLSLLLYAVLCYVPLLLTAPGKIAADTKAYLYLEPGRLLSRAGWLWEQDVAAGTITHQNIGYLFPMGPWYWVFDRLGSPDWVAQRLWLGTVLFVAGAGVRWLCHRLDLHGTPATVAGIVYLASPYVVPYFGRTSALLLPWAALPWLLALVVVALRTNGWRAPVLFALVFTCVSGTNASSLVFIAIGPLLWVPYAIWGLREIDVARARRVSIRLALTTIPLQLWWVAGLRIQGRYGLPILQLTESVDTVAQTSTAAEVSRGLGYWYDYGRDGLSPWTNAARGYTQSLWLIAASFAVPTVALLAACFTRWRLRGYAIAIFAVGLVAGVGTYPYHDPPLFGAVVKATTETAGGLALRNSPRSVPLIGLAYALLLAAGLRAVIEWTRANGRGRTLARGFVGGVAILGVANAQPLFTGAFVSPDLRFPEELPAYVRDAAATLDRVPHTSRVLELPGSDFAAYRWGQTQDPVIPGLLDRPWVGRELTAFGTPGSVDLVRALDRRAQEGVFEAAAVAPIARLLAAGDVLVRNDIQFERYRGPRPRTLWPALAGAGGFGPTTAYGTPFRSVADPRRPLIDEIELGTPPSVADPPPLASRVVLEPNPLVGAKSIDAATIVAGDGDGLVDLAVSGLIDPTRAVLYSATFARNDATLRTLAANGAALVVTDTNRKRAQRWGTVRENNGYTEPANSGALVADTKDARLMVFPDAGTNAYSVARYVGVADITASAYGNIVAYSPERRAANALDGDLRTAWEVGGFSDVLGERLRITLDTPVTVDHFDLAQSNGNRFITVLGVRLDGGPLRRIALDDSSHSDAGQRIDLGSSRTFSVLELSIEDANVSGLQNYLGWSTAGIREVNIVGVTMEEQVELPRDLLATLGPASRTNSLAIVLTRQRADAGEPFRADPEQLLVRSFELPTQRTFSLRGQARIETRVDGRLIDQVLGRSGTGAGFITASGGDFLAGSLRMRPSSAVDGDPTTFWSPGLGDQVGRSFHVELPFPMSIASLDLAIVADGRHSVPTQLTLDAEDGTSRVVNLPPIEDDSSPEHVWRVTLPIAPVTTSGLRVRVTGVREVTTTEYFSGDRIALPVGIAELGLPINRPLAGLTTEMQNGLGGTCRGDLLSIDGSAVGIRLVGPTATALAGGALEIVTCDGAPLTLGPGAHVLRTAKGLDTGIALDRLVLESAATPSAATPSAATSNAVPSVELRSQSRLLYQADVQGATGPFWLILHESLSDGWHATIKGVDLGAPTMIDGYANGWLVDPTRFGSDFRVKLQWTPQRVVWVAIAASAFALVVLVVVALVLWRREARATDGRPRWTADVRGPTPKVEIRSAEGRPVGVRRALRDAALFGVLGGVLGGVSVAVPVALLVFMGRRFSAGRMVLRVVPWAAFVFVSFWYTAKQYRNHFPLGVEWPQSFATTHSMVLIAMMVLVADAVLSRAHPASPATSRDPLADSAG